MDNMTLKIDHEGDLVIGKDGMMQVVGGIDTTAQNIRMTLKAAKEDFPLVPEHGTDYGTVFGVAADNEVVREAYREAIFQEDDVEQIDSLTVDVDGRMARVEFSASTAEGDKVEESI